MLPAENDGGNISYKPRMDVHVLTCFEFTVQEVSFYYSSVMHNLCVHMKVSMLVIYSKEIS